MFDADVTVLVGDIGVGRQHHMGVVLEYRIDQGRVVSTPRGYGGIAEVAGFDPYRVVDGVK